MGFSINTNVSALQAYNSLNNTQNKLQNSLQRLSSGYRINYASDDAAGLSISEGLQSQISGTSVASNNAQDGISLLQTTDGALTQVQSILHRMRDLAVQGANGTNDGDAKEAIQTEADQLSQELGRMEQNTTFNGISLLSSSGGTLSFQVGAGANDPTGTTDGDFSNTISFSSVDLSTDLTTTDSTGTYSLDDATDDASSTGFDISSNDAANATIARIDAAIKAVSSDQATIGATENRFSDAVQTLAVTSQNLSAANSRIQDTDMASEMVSYSQESVLQQAGVSMLAQANASGQGILKLLS